MRLDVFLKQSRLVKRRPLAKELCDEGVVFLNGRAARAGHEVSPGDTLRLHLRSRRLAVVIKALPARAPSTAEAARLYDVVSDERVDVDEP